MQNKQYHNFIVVTVLSISLICGNASESQAQAAPCVSDIINELCDPPKPETPTDPAFQPPPNPAPYSLTPITADDIEIKYRYSDPNGIGQEQELVKNATLHTGDRFTIHVTPKSKREMYLYIFHFDNTGKVKELMNFSRLANEITRRPTFILPAQDEHFYLDDTVGTEHIHAIVSPYPLPDLIARYQLSRLTAQELQDGAKVIGGWRNPNQPAPSADPTQGGGKDIGVRRNPTQPAPSADPNSCLAGEFCRDTMVIQHLGR